MAMCGGLSQAKDADSDLKEVQVICDKIRGQLENASNLTVTEFTAVKFKSQVVAGTNFFVKVRIGTDAYVHVRIFRPLPHTGEDPSYVAHQTGKTLEDEIDHFEKQ